MDGAMRLLRTLAAAGLAFASALMALSPAGATAKTPTVPGTYALGTVASLPTNTLNLASLVVTSDNSQTVTVNGKASPAEVFVITACASVAGPGSINPQMFTETANGITTAAVSSNPTGVSLSLPAKVSPLPTTTTLKAGSCVTGWIVMFDQASYLDVPSLNVSITSAPVAGTTSTYGWTLSNATTFATETPLLTAADAMQYTLLKDFNLPPVGGIATQLQKLLPNVTISSNSVSTPGVLFIQEVTGRAVVLGTIVTTPQGPICEYAGVNTGPADSTGMNLGPGISFTVAGAVPHAGASCGGLGASRTPWNMNPIYVNSTILSSYLEGQVSSIAQVANVLPAANNSSFPSATSAESTLSYYLPQFAYSSSTSTTEGRVTVRQVSGSQMVFGFPGPGATVGTNANPVCTYLSVDLAAGGAFGVGAASTGGDYLATSKKTCTAALTTTTAPTKWVNVSSTASENYDSLYLAGLHGQALTMAALNAANALQAPSGQFPTTSPSLLGQQIPGVSIAAAGTTPDTSGDLTLQQVSNTQLVMGTYNAASQSCLYDSYNTGTTSGLGAGTGIQLGTAPGGCVSLTAFPVDHPADAPTIFTDPLIVQGEAEAIGRVAEAYAAGNGNRFTTAGSIAPFMTYLGTTGALGSQVANSLGAGSVIASTVVPNSNPNKVIVQEHTPTQIIVSIYGDTAWLQSPACIYTSVNVGAGSTMWTAQPAGIAYGANLYGCTTLTAPPVGTWWVSSAP